MEKVEEKYKEEKEKKERWRIIRRRRGVGEGGGEVKGGEERRGGGEKLWGAASDFQGFCKCISFTKTSVNTISIKSSSILILFSIFLHNCPWIPFQCKSTKTKFNAFHKYA